MNDRFKNLLLVVLCISMVGLFAVNLTLALDSRFSQVKQTLGIGRSQGLSVGGNSASIMPAKLGILGAGGLYLAKGGEMNELFSTVNPILSEALGSVGRISAISRGDFLDCLGRQGIYFSFTFSVPFYLLQYWWTGEMGFSSEQTASALVLTVGDESVRLAFYDAGADRFYMAETAAGYERLSTFCQGFRTSNAFFAFSSDGSHMLRPWEPVYAQGAYYPTYIAVATDFTVEGAITQELLAAFSVNAFLAKEYKTTGGDVVYVENYTALQFSRSGAVAYSSTAQQGIDLDMPEGISQKEELAYVVARTHRLLSGIYGTVLSQCTLSLAEISDDGSGGYVLAFERGIGGGFVTEEDGYTAVVTVKDGVVTEMRLWMKNYTQAQEVMLLPHNLVISLIEERDSCTFVRYKEKDGMLLPGIYVVEGGAGNGME